MYIDKTRTAWHTHSSPGFTLIELIIVITIGVVLLALTSPVGVSFYQRILAEDAQEEVIVLLREASNEARLGGNDIAHGVHFATGSLTHFQGVTYASRVASADYVVPLHPRANVSGLPSDIVFASHTGIPSATGTLTLVLYGYTHTTMVNPLGFIWDTTTTNSPAP